MVPGQEANGDNLGNPFRSSIRYYGMLSALIIFASMRQF